MSSKKFLSTFLWVGQGGRGGGVGGKKEGAWGVGVGEVQNSPNTVALLNYLFFSLYSLDPFVTLFQIFLSKMSLLRSLRFEKCKNVAFKKCLCLCTPHARHAHTRSDVTKLQWHYFRRLALPWLLLTPPWWLWPSFKIFSKSVGEGIVLFLCLASFTHSDSEMSPEQTSQLIQASFCIHRYLDRSSSSGSCFLPHFYWFQMAAVLSHGSSVKTAYIVECWTSLYVGR